MLYVAARIAIRAVVLDEGQRRAAHPRIAWIDTVSHGWPAFGDHDGCGAAAAPVEPIAAKLGLQPRMAPPESAAAAGGDERMLIRRLKAAAWMR